jgi:hypothetical protein
MPKAFLAHDRWHLADDELRCDDAAEEAPDAEEILERDSADELEAAVLKKIPEYIESSVCEDCDWD